MKCWKCKNEKPIEQFLKRVKLCKECKSLMDKEYRKKNKEKIAKNAYNYWRNNSEIKASNKKSKEKNRFGFDATAYVENKKCEMCGMTNSEHKNKYNERLHLHHNKNTGRKNQRLGLKPIHIELMVLCRSCHVSKDNRENREYKHGLKK
jgi:hypothetical protein